jgi:hypothetical protein
LRFIEAPEKLGQLTSAIDIRSTEIVENPVEKIHENRFCVALSEEISGLHHHGAIRPPPCRRHAKPTDYTLLTS